MTKYPARLIPRRDSQGFADGLTQGNPGVLDRMVLVDIKIALGVQGQIHHRMPGDQLEHVVEEPYPGVDVVASAAVEVESDFDLRLSGAAVDACLSHPYLTLMATEAA